MELVTQFKAGRQAQKLRAAGTLEPEALRKVQDDLVSYGKAAIGPVAECLADEGAIAPAREVLTKLITDESLGDFLHALDAAGPRAARELKELLSTATSYRAASLLERLGTPPPLRGALLDVVEAQWERIPPLHVARVLPSLPREAQSHLLQTWETRPLRGAASDLRGLVAHEDPWLRQRAARLLVRFGEEAGGFLVSLLADSQRGVRREAAHSLHVLRHRPAVPALTRLLRDVDLQVQSSAIDALVAIGDPGAVPHLVELLGDESEYVRRAAVEVLNAVATPDAVQDLLGAIRDKDWWVRVRAADALASLGGACVVQAAIEIMREDDEFLRRQAVEILNAIPDPEAFEVLAEALDDDDWWVRERAIDALGKMEDPRAVEPLSRLAAGEETAAALAVRALGAIGGEAARAALETARSSASERVRDEAERVLREGEEGRRAGPDGKRAPGGRVPGRRDPASEASLPWKIASPPGSPEGSGSEVREAVPRPDSTPRSGQRPPQPGTATPLNYSDLPPGTVLLDRFRVLRKIGRGGFAAVYLVSDQAIEVDLILKVLHPQLAFEEDALRRFVQELKVTRRITHRNVIRIHDILDLGGAHGVSMEYFPSRDLGERIREAGKLPVERVLRIAAQTCRGLEAAHREGVIHRDVKPANLLVGENDETKIVDFGLAAAQQGSGSRMTKSGLLLGTPEYMAPEQIADEPVDARADLYSLGIVLYETLSGRRPFSAETPVKVLFQHLEGEATPLESLEPSLPDSVVRLTAWAMSRLPQRRPASAARFGEALERALAECTGRP